MQPKNLSTLETQLLAENENLREISLHLECQVDSLKALFNNSPVAYVVLTSEGCIAQCNTEGLRLLNTTANEVQGALFSKFFRPEHRSDWFKHFFKHFTSFPSSIGPLGIAILPSPIKDECTLILRCDNETHIKITSIRSSDRLLYCVLMDVTSHIKESKRLLDMAFNDALTGLPNRRMFNERMTQAQFQSERTGKFAALMFLDLNKFKCINDTFGHDAGDKLLVNVAGLLRHHIRKVDFVARLGGDEFAIVVADISSHHDIAAGKVQSLITEIKDIISKPMALSYTDPSGKEQNLVYQCKASLGYKLFSGCKVPVSVLTAAADASMYQDKNVSSSTNTQDIKS